MTNYPDSRGTCVRVDLSAIAHNARTLKKAVGEKVRMMAVVKANAYGHGLVPVAKTALENGASFLGVAVPEEGRSLRQAGVEIDPGHLIISDRATICLPYHKLLDGLEEDRLGDKSKPRAKPVVCSMPIRQ